LIVKKRGVFKTPYSLKEKSEAPQAAKLTLFRCLLVDSIAGIAVAAILTSSPGPQKLKTPSMACLFRTPLPKKPQSTTLGRLSHSITPMSSMGAVVKTNSN
jgi:hypothetical protein